MNCCTLAASSSSAMPNTSVSTSSRSTTARLRQRRVHRADRVAEAGGLLEVQRGRRLLHPLRQVAAEPLVPAAHEGREVLRERAVRVLRDAADARRRALADVAEQARPAGLLGPPVGRLGAAAHREDLEHQVERLPDRPDLRVRTEVLGALQLPVARDQHPRHLVAERDREVRVRLVVPELHVERRRELLDPAVLELERLELGADDGPLDARRGEHHAPRALVQRPQGLEVVAEPCAEVLRLPDVQHATPRVAEPVDARRGRGSPPSSAAS